MSKGKTLKNTFGWARVKVLGLLVNMLFLGALCFAACVEAVQTMVHASHEDTEPRYPLLMVILGCINFCLNILCFLLIGGYTHHQGRSMIIQGSDVPMNCSHADSMENPKYFSNVRTPPTMSFWDFSRKDSSRRWCGYHQILDVSRDISSCLTVIVCGSIILLMDGLILKYVDAILAILSLIVLLSTTYPFIRESGLILLQSIPNHIDVDGLTKRLIAEFPDLINVHDLHVWRLTTSEVIATVHVILSSSDIYARIEKRLNQFFLKEGISSATIQPEFPNGSVSEKTKTECILQCSVNNNCGALTCCGPLTEKSKQNTRCRGSLGHKHSIQKEEPLLNVNIVPDNELLPQYDFTQIVSANETTL
ncbi:hypothetical protein TNCV_5094031 [Trichonephila clavipes]|nr:hypothetical protein TNCV_5094031 [Trichonephila clavipes]